MLRIVLIRPGCTDFDEQRRIQGSLDLPLSDEGQEQVVGLADQLSDLELSAVYVAPDEASTKTGQAIAKRQHLKVKELDSLANLNHGLWHGKLVSEVKQQQPKVYRQWQENPETICPPEGETVQSAQDRVRKVLMKIIKKHKEGMVGLVVSEPLASMVRCALLDTELRDLWQGSLNCGQWVVLEVVPERAACK